MKLTLVLQDPSEIIFWAGFYGLNILPEMVFGAQSGNSSHHQEANVTRKLINLPSIHFLGGSC